MLTTYDEVDALLDEIIEAGPKGKFPYKTISFDPEIVKLPLEEQLTKIEKIIQNHYREKDGKGMFFGDITGYVYFPEFDGGIDLTIYGKVIRKDLVQLDIEHFRGACLSVGGRKFTVEVPDSGNGLRIKGV